MQRDERQISNNERKAAPELLGRYRPNIGLLVQLNPRIVAESLVKLMGTNINSHHQLGASLQ